jgi:hypothetical protein
MQELFDTVGIVKFTFRLLLLLSEYAGIVRYCWYCESSYSTINNSIVKAATQQLTIQVQ